MVDIVDFIDQFGILNQDEIRAIISKAKGIHLKKRDYLLRAGEVCRNLYFLKEGAVRAFYLKKGKEIVTWFVLGGEPLAPFYSFSMQKPGIEYVQLIEDSFLYAISYQDLEELYAKHHRIEHFGRKMIELYYRSLEERLMSLQLMTAKERYEQLMKERPEVIQKVPLGYIASYLGISQETLSRIRKV